ncbi:MAG: dicarboxylate/amino acid:cation symporter, partial [Myxococcales bacterium]|nr:dicarboxylate/amino acid:cation symporter [Myxococcales bacterium]
MSNDTKRPWYGKMHWQILIALALGVGAGLLSRYLGYEFTADSERTVFWYPGEVFLRLLKMIVLPLILTSVIVGVSGLNRERLGRIGLKTMAFYVSTMAIAVVIGLVVVNIIQPGVGADLGSAATPSVEPQPIDDMLLDIIPTNFFEALTAKDILSVIFFAIFFGLAIAHTDKGKPIRKVIESANEVIMKLTMWIMALAPLGVFGLIAHQVAVTGIDAFDELLWYMVAVLVGLAIHATVVLPGLLVVFGKRKPGEFASAMSPALLTAYSSASSSSTLPVTIQNAVERGGVPRPVAEFVLPLGATVNMDGTALYEAVAVLFIAQAYGIDMDLSTQIVVALTATMAAIGAAGVP